MKLSYYYNNKGQLCMGRRSVVRPAAWIAVGQWTVAIVFGLMVGMLLKAVLNVLAAVVM